MNYTNYVSDIAKINEQDRFDAITSVLKENGIPYTIQRGIYVDKSIENIIVSINDSIPDRIVIGAHYDNFTGTPGANDNAAGCSILLNLTLALKDTPWPIDFVFFDREENFALGSTYYRNTIGLNHISAMVNLDMCGLGNNTLIQHACPLGKELVEPLNKFFTKEVRNDYEFVKILPFGDATYFMIFGVPTFYIISSTDRDIHWYNMLASSDPSIGEDFAGTDFAETMHKPNDTPDTLNYEHIEQIYNMLLKVFL